VLLLLVRVRISVCVGGPPLRECQHSRRTLRLVSTCVLTLLRRDTVRRSLLGIPTAVRLRIHGGRHAVALLRCRVCHPLHRRAGHWRTAVAASRVSSSGAPTSATSRTRVRGLVDSDGPSVEPK
jgi:hypothetical protein